MNIHGWKFVKKKMDCSRKDQVKKKYRKNGLEQKQKKKKWREKKKKSISAI